MDEQKYCRYCGAANSTRAAFCANCGKTFTSASLEKNDYTGDTLTADTKFKFCKNCGRKVSLNGQLCARCGADLGPPEEQNVPQDAVSAEIVVGYTSHVFLGGSLGTANGVLLFTTDRTVMAKASGGFVAQKIALGVIGYAIELRSHAERMAGSTKIDEILSENKKNYAIPHSAITQLRVKLPGALTKGSVTLTTAQGEKVFKISNRGAFGVVKDDWGFLKSPPSKLAGKLVEVE